MSVVAGTHAMQTRSLTGKLWLPLCSIPSHSDRSTKVAGCCIERADPMPQWRGSPSPWTSPYSWMQAPVFFLATCAEYPFSIDHLRICADRFE